MIKIMRACLCGLCMILLAGSYVKADQELELVKQAIAAKGAKWHADETTIWKLSHEERRMKLGLVKAHMPDAPLLTAPAPSSVAALPATLDWRNNNGNWVTKVRNQGSCGSCWAFAATANLESVALIKAGVPLAREPTLIFPNKCWFPAAVPEAVPVVRPGSASNYIKSTGLPPESCDPYTATNGTCPATCTQPYYKIASWSYVATSNPTVDAIKNALSTYGPVNTTMEVYSDFFAYRSGVYSYTTGTYQGAHAILIVGYDDSTQSFICKNSWDVTWGDQGFFHVAYSELNSVTQFGYYTIAYQMNPAPPPPTCTYAVSQPTNPYTYTGGKGSSSVTAGSGCAWTASSSAAWITITAGKSGTGNGTVSYTVAANTTTASRTANLNIAGKTFTISQSGAPGYIISASAGANGTISPSGSVNVTAGTSQTFKIAPTTGYKIATVLVDSLSVGAVSSYTFPGVAANHTISASFAPVTYTLTISKSGLGGGTVTSNPTGTTLNAGTSVTLTATPDATSTFGGWSGACSGKLSTCTVTMSRNLSVTATFNKRAK